MSFTEAVRTCLSKYVVWQGRASRAEYWWFALFTVVVAFAAALLGAAAGSAAIGYVVILALFLPSLSAAIRRLHDSGRSGAWYLIVLVPFVGGIVLLVLMLLEGDAGANRYGPPPTGERVAVGA